MNRLEELILSYRARVDELRSSRPKGPISTIEALIGAIGTQRLPEPGESAAIAIEQPKTAALMFDRVWAIGSQAPESVRFCGATLFELSFLLRMSMVLEYQRTRGVDGLLPNLSRTQLARVLEKSKPLVARPSDLHSYSLRDELVRLLHDIYREDQPVSGAADLPSFFARRLAEHYNVESQLQVTPVYPSVIDRDAAYGPGGHSVLVAALTNLGIINEESLDWQQVIEFRSDREARGKLQRFRQWAEMEMEGRTASEIADEIGLRVEDYKWSLKKHGIETILGALSTTLDSSVLTGAAAAGGVVGAAAGAGVGSLVGAAILIGKIAVEVSRRRLDLAATSRTADPAVSYVLEAQTKLGN